MCVASVQTNVTSPNALITPSSLTHACSTSAQSELCLFTSVPVGQVCSKKPWTTSTDTHSLGSLSCPPIKGVYHRLPHDVIPSPSAKLITALYPGMCICVHVDVCVKDSTCQSKPLSLMNPGLEWGTIKWAVCAAKGQSHKRLWWILFFLSPFKSAVTYQSSENHQVAGGTQGGVEDLPVKSAQNVGLTASWQIEIKIKQRSSVFFKYYFISHLSKKRFLIICLLVHFLCLIDSLNVNGMRQCKSNVELYSLKQKKGLCSLCRMCGPYMEIELSSFSLISYNFWDCWHEVVKCCIDCSHLCIILIKWVSLCF